jgi:Family of unknown function (DUF6350)
MPANVLKRPARRRPADLTLRATETDAEPTVALNSGPEQLPVAWPIAAPVGGLIAAAVAWILVAGLTVLGWLSTDVDTVAGSLADALLVGSQLWVYANGAGLAAGGLHVTLIPWGALALFGFLLARCSGFAAARTGGRSRTTDPFQHESRRPESAARTAVGIGLLAAFGYLTPVAVVALFVGAPAPNPRMLVGVAALLGCAVWGSSRALDVHPTYRWPGWLRTVPSAVLGTQLVLIVAGAAVVISSLLVQLDRVGSLGRALDAGVAGNIALLVGQLAFAPTAMVWGAAYALGAGFGLGDGSVVAPAATQVGLLPGLPLLGAVPSSGPGGVYQLLWLTAGVLAGLVAAWLVVRRRPAARCDETALVGGLSGVLGALVFTGVAWASSGDLGVARLVGLGPRLPELIVMAVSTLGLSGMVGGLLLGLWRGRRHDPDQTDPDQTDPGGDEATIQLNREEALSGSR